MLDSPDTPLADYRTLHLNGDYRPLSIFPLSTLCWEEAITGVLVGKLTLISTYERVVRSASKSFAVPSVVASRGYVDLNRPAARTRWNVMLAHRFTCAYCGARHEVKDLTFDHVVPRSKGGFSTWYNLVPACAPCNQRKADKTPREAKMTLRSPPYQPTEMMLNGLALKFAPEHKGLHRHWIDYIYWDSNLDA